jgi:hypothetical protein
VALKDSIRGYQFIQSNLRQLDLAQWGDFSEYATRWEKRYSVLIDDKSSLMDAVPVVDHKIYSFLQLPIGKVSMFPVIAHYVTVPVYDIIVAKRFTVQRTEEAATQLSLILDQGMEAYVEENYPDAGNWAPLCPHASNLGPNYYTVLVDPEGRIITVFNKFGAEKALISEDPLFYVTVVALSLKLATAGARIVFRMITRKVAQTIPAAVGVEIVSPVYRIAERDVVIVNTSAGRQAFYRSTGINSGRAGKWLPVDEFRPYDGWFNKAAYVYGPGVEEGAALHRLGTEEFARISEELGNKAIPRGYVVPAGNIENAEMTLNRILDFFGARQTPTTFVRPVPDPPVPVR